jgi:phosphate starvation-inducible protein PhoH
LHTHWRTVQAAELERRFNPQFSPVKGLTPNQDRYLQLIREKVVTLCLGPAGTGKTWCPAALGAEWLREGKVERVVLTRPLVTCSAGNRDALGILPGEMREKIGPYLRPLLDVFQAKASPAEVEKWIQGGRIDLVPLDVMRGLSFKNALVIADEMQNANRSQFHMLLTRFAENSKVVVSGDPTQSDLARGRTTFSGRVSPPGRAAEGRGAGGLYPPGCGETPPHRVAGPEAGHVGRPGVRPRRGREQTWSTGGLCPLRRGPLVQQRGTRRP